MRVMACLLCMAKAAPPRSILAHVACGLGLWCGRERVSRSTLHLTRPTCLNMGRWKIDLAENMRAVEPADDAFIMFLPTQQAAHTASGSIRGHRSSCPHLTFMDSPPGGKFAVPLHARFLARRCLCQQPCSQKLSSAGALGCRFGSTVSFGGLCQNNATVVASLRRFPSSVDC